MQLLNSSIAKNTIRSIYKISMVCLKIVPIDLVNMSFASEKKVALYRSTYLDRFSAH